jgi:hypothetical protein
MPFLNVSTNIPRPGNYEDIVKQLSQLVAKTTGKPEQVFHPFDGLIGSM